MHVKHLDQDLVPGKYSLRGAVVVIGVFVSVPCLLIKPTAP